ncbi:MAG: hypothetical protein ACPGQQ_05620 [Candidatus Puniceispirillaceae bacterium]
MGRLNPFSKPKDNSAQIRAQQAAQEARIREQEAKLAKEEKERQEKEEAKKKASLSARKGRSGGTSLLTGLETGVTPEDQKRGTLG